jgi:hypothetical protein
MPFPEKVIFSYIFVSWAKTGNTMQTDKNYKSTEFKDRYKVWFFAGGETRDDRFNIFTGSFIRIMKQILEDDFEFIRGIYYKTKMRNVMWALNNAQKPVSNPENQKIISAAFTQIISDGLSPDTQLVIISSSTGSIVAAQTACYLAERNRNKTYFRKPFHLVLGASMISSDSDLFKQLILHQDNGIIGTIIHNEIQDEGDSSTGVGGLSRMEAYSNAFGLMFPFLSLKFSGPSFLNAHPEKGHIHRKRSKTIQKAIDYINIILIKNKLAGEYYGQIADRTLQDITSFHI